MRKIGVASNQSALGANFALHADPQKIGQTADVNIHLLGSG